VKVPTGCTDGLAFFNRQYALEVISFGQTKGVTYSNIDSAQTSLRVQFSFERNMEGNADKGKVSIYNLNQHNRNAIVRGSTMRLRAGYRSRIGLLFTAFVRKITTEQQGPDVVTSFELGDGEPSINYGHVNRSYTSPVNLARVLQDISGDLDLDLGGDVAIIAPGVIKGIPDKVFSSGLALEGGVKHVLNGLLRPHKIDWKIHNNKLMILPRAGTLYVSAAVISSASGMTGVPALTEKYMTFQSLLNSNLAPGALVEMRSRNGRLDGYYKLRSCKYNGDTHDAPWLVDCEAELLKAPLPIFVAAQGANFAPAVVP
jgi:hypothetical protein